MIAKLTVRDLEGEFLRITGDKTFRRTQEIAGADGIMFCCPKCFPEKGGSVGTHSIICWSPHVAEHMRPGPGRWSLQGSSIDDVSLVASSSSILLDGGCGAHFFVRNGQIEMA
jgi:hypothetical protein